MKSKNFKRQYPDSKKSKKSAENITAEIKAAEPSVKASEVRKTAAARYQRNLKMREAFLRRLHYESEEADRWYGSSWVEGKAGVESIQSSGDEDLHVLLPVQSKMRRCVVKDGKLRYYLDPEDSYKKEDGSPADLTGADGDVCVQIPEFFFCFEEKMKKDGRHISLKISEQGIKGYTYSPNMYIGAYEAAMDHATGRIVSVCTTEFEYAAREIVTESKERYLASEEGFSRGIQKTASITGYTLDAARYRGSNNDSTYDGIMDPDDINFWLNHLGKPVAGLSREDFRKAEDPEHGKLMSTYDSHRALWILSMTEFKMKNIQRPFAEGGLGMGATTEFAYDAFKQWAMNTSESMLPCGVTNTLGNRSGEVYMLFKNAPVYIEGEYPQADLSSLKRGDIWVPCMSYRGVEHYYGHLYKTLDQINLYCEDTGEDRKEDGKDIFDVWYYYQENPFLTDNLRRQSELAAKVRFCPVISNTFSYLFGERGHILPVETTDSLEYENECYYDDTTEYGVGFGGESEEEKGVMQVEVNGSLINHYFPGRNMIVGVFPADGSVKRASNGTRITYLDCRKSEK